MESDLTKKTIRDFIFENFLMGLSEDELSDTDSFLEKGIIDSTGVLELVAFVEESFTFDVEDEELVPENFDSVVKLETYIQRKKAGGDGNGAS
jgi:acyl carrier protein